jgi:hypothetical protein
MNMNNDATEFDSIVHRNLRRKKVGLGPLRFLLFLGITMGVLILMAMAAPSAHAALLTYYDFEDGNFTSDSPGLQTTSIVTLLGTFTFPAGTGTMVNAVTPETTNTALTLHPANGEGSFKLGGLTTTGLTDVHLSFALLSAATGGSFTDLQLFYSINGGASFNQFANVNITNHTDYNPALTFDVSALTGGAVDGVSGGNLFFGFLFTGATDSDAATFIDNIQVTAVPEPTTWIGGALGFPFIGFVYLQRRRRAQMLRRA